ncbi:choline-sulfatase [Acetobacter conturbans]|uniref:Choline-sulfatase n=1 Tax=Acetobacter conturbans TaxID=1737472 RepID=A0ABX0K034_9PROT|nr:choline-sulfatase [Acetobacter conturbans]NHN89024.1 choline-sulfatase [Acetobacter conturbans]
MTKQPNILILMADQLTARALPAYGNRVAKTPHLNALAERSVIFENAYCNMPLCAPSRSVFMSGRLASHTGAFDNAAEFPSRTPTFAHYLRLAGYETILTGKMHFCGPDQLHGFETRLTTDIYPADYNWTPDWSNFGERLEWYHTMNSVTEAGWCIRTNQIDFDEEVVFSARQKLFDMARDPGHRPFAMVVSLTHPHDPFTIPDPWWSRYTDEDIDMPRVPSLPESERDPHSQRLRHVNGMDLQPVTEEQVRAARRAYYGACSFVDDNVGVLMETLKQTGFDDNTVVILLADHGEMLGERGMWYKMSFFEGSSHIPLMVSWPKAFSPHRVSECVSLVDILPTLADLAGASAPELLAVDGHSLVPFCSGQQGHDEVLGEYTAEGALAPVLMIRRGDEKFIYCPIDPDQYYNLKDDPDELHNLAAEPACADRVRAFREEIHARWDVAKLTDAIRLSQAERHLVNGALETGVRTSWDHQPVRDAASMYIRSHMDLEDLEKRARFPTVSP